MVQFVTSHSVLQEEYHSSKEYREGTKEVRDKIDEWLDRRDVKDHYGKRFMMRLTVREQLILEYLNSGEFQKKTPEERDKEIKLLTSKAAEEASDAIERIMRGEEVFEQRDYTTRPVASWFHY